MLDLISKFILVTSPMVMPNKCFFSGRDGTPICQAPPTLGNLLFVPTGQPLALGNTWYFCKLMDYKLLPHIGSLKLELVVTKSKPLLKIANVFFWACQLGPSKTTSSLSLCYQLFHYLSVLAQSQ